MKYIKLLSIILSLPLPVLSQERNGGIEFAKKLTWEEAKSKAQSENKYIFVDCYATWCGPCKRMDEQVYTQDSVGETMNNKFISLKVQMDKTATDGEQIKRWYATADDMSKEYKVTAFPTFLFFSPDGQIVGREVGFKRSDEFLAIAKNAINPQAKYIDPYSLYDKLLGDYHKGKKDYKQMPYLIKMARNIGESKLVDSLSKEYLNYLSQLRENELYTKENIDFIANNLRESKQKLFRLFYPTGKKADKVMNEPGFSQRVIDRIIRIEITNPFIESVKHSAYPNWQELYRTLRKRYTAEQSDYSELSAKIRWCQYKTLTAKQGFRDLYLKYFVLQIQIYGVDRANISLTASPGAQHQEALDITLNSVAWDIFNYSKKDDQIKEAIKWMKAVVDRSNSYNPNWEMSTKDTYANLLFKANKITEAINLEKEIVDYAKKTNDENALKGYQATLNTMLKGEPTWNVEK